MDIDYANDLEDVNENINSFLKINKNIQKILESKNIKMIEDILNPFIYKLSTTGFNTLLKNDELYNITLSNIISLIEFYDERNINYETLKTKLDYPYMIEKYENKIINYLISKINELNKNNENVNSINIVKDESLDVVSQYLSYYEIVFKNNNEKYIERLSKLHNCLVNKDKLYDLYLDEIESLQKELNVLKEDFDSNTKNEEKCTKSITKSKHDISSLKKDIIKASAYILTFTGIVSASIIGANKTIPPVYKCKKITMSNAINHSTISDEICNVDTINTDISFDKTNLIILKEISNRSNELLKKYEIHTEKTYTDEELREMFYESFDKYKDFLVSNYLSPELLNDIQIKKVLTYIEKYDEYKIMGFLFKTLMTIAYGLIPSCIYLKVKYDNDRNFEIEEIIYDIEDIISQNININASNNIKYESLSKLDNIVARLNEINNRAKELKQEDILNLFDKKNELMTKLDSLEQESQNTLSLKK